MQSAAVKLGIDAQLYSLSFLVGYLYKMGLRQSKRSVDISSSPKKDAAITEKQVNDVAVPNENVVDELNKSTKEEVIQEETKVLTNLNI